MDPIRQRPLLPFRAPSEIAAPTLRPPDLPAPTDGFTRSAPAPVAPPVGSTPAPPAAATTPATPPAFDPHAPIAILDAAPTEAPRNVFGRRPSPPSTGSTTNDMYHDVGMYRSKSTDEALDDTVRILAAGAIAGGSAKGAQVSANAGPTNWFGSDVTVRIKRKPHETGVLYPDDNCPLGANWYGTFARGVRLPVDVREVEILVNGSSPEEAAARADALQKRLADAGLGQVPVVPIDRFLETRFTEIASHLPSESRQPFIDGMAASPFWTQKAVGEMAGLMGDGEFAKWREHEVPAVYRDAQREIVGWYAREKKPDRGEEIAERFIRDADSLSEGEQLVLAKRIKTPYTYAVASCLDGYEALGNGIHNALTPPG